MKPRLTLIASLVCIVGALVSAQPPAPAAAAAPPKIAVLIVTGQHGHNWRGTTPLLRKALEDTGKFEVRVTEEFRGAGPEALAPYDLVVLNYFDRNRPELRWGEKTDAAFLDFVRSGKGVVVYHFSVAAFNGWTEYEKLSGGNWRPDKGHHSAPHNFVVDIKDQEHPITKGLKLSLPQTNDELYANLRWQPAGSYHVLATANDDHGDDRILTMENGELIVLEGFLMPCLIAQNIGQQVVRLGVARIVGEHALQAACGLIELIGAAARFAELEQSGTIARLRLQIFPQRRPCRREISRQQRRDAEVVVRLGELRLQCQCSAKAERCVVSLPLLQQRTAEVGVRGRKVRRDRDRLFVTGDRLVQLLLVLVVVAEVEIQLRVGVRAFRGRNRAGRR